MYLDAFGAAEGAGVPESESFWARLLTASLPTSALFVGGGRTKAMMKCRWVGGGCNWNSNRAPAIVSKQNDPSSFFPPALHPRRFSASFLPVRGKLRGTTLVTKSFTLFGRPTIAFQPMAPAADDAPRVTHVLRPHHVAILSVFILVLGEKPSPKFNLHIWRVLAQEIAEVRKALLS